MKTLAYAMATLSLGLGALGVLYTVKLMNDAAKVMEIANR